MIWAVAFAIHFTLKQKKRITITQPYLLFFDSESPDDNTQSILSVHLLSRLEDFG